MSRLILLLIVVPLLACEAPTQYVDPKVNYGDKPPYTPTGTPTLDVGFYEEQLYTRLDPESELPIVFGTQGGTWVMPALRQTGLLEEVEITATLTTDDGERIGFTEAKQRFVLAFDGWLELQFIPIPVKHVAPNEDDPITDLFDVGAELTVKIIDEDGREAETSLHVILVEG